jgi:hypothetical protein
MATDRARRCERAAAGCGRDRVRSARPVHASGQTAAERAGQRLARGSQGQDSHATAVGPAEASARAVQALLSRHRRQRPPRCAEAPDRRARPCPGSPEHPPFLPSLSPLPLLLLLPRPTFPPAALPLDAAAQHQRALVCVGCTVSGAQHHPPAGDRSHRVADPVRRIAAYALPRRGASPPASSSRHSTPPPRLRSTRRSGEKKLKTLQLPGFRGVGTQQLS